MQFYLLERIYRVFNSLKLWFYLLLLKYFSKGIVLVGGDYIDENGEAAGGGHQMTATGIEINDANGNARLDRGEAFLLMIDPLVLFHSKA